MILRPDSDADLISTIAKVLADEAIQLDTRAMVALLLARRDLQRCPLKLDLPAILGIEAGTARIARMVREAIAAGYMTRAAANVPRDGRRWLYSFIVGMKTAVRSGQGDAGR